MRIFPPLPHLNELPGTYGAHIIEGAFSAATPDELPKIYGRL